LEPTTGPSPFWNFFFCSSFTTSHCVLPIHIGTKRRSCKLSFKFRNPKNNNNFLNSPYQCQINFYLVPIA
jgi:hypothetical protein